MSRLFSGEAGDYSSLVSSLNGRFRNFSARNSAIIYDGRGNFDLSRNSSAKTLIMLSIMTILIGAWLKWSDFDQTLIFIRSFDLGWLYISTGMTMLGINIVAFLWRLSLVARYAPAPVCTDQQLPTCTVLVPAYNEGKQVLRTLRSIARSDFPGSKLEIIAIDDGSKDDTWYWIEKAARELDGRIITIKMPKNGGKRAALNEGFKIGTGDVFVTIDSDSLIEPQTLRRLLSPFYHNKQTGAVAGSVRVLNRHEGIIPRMLDVTFAYCFEFIRSSESQYNTVFCTPGALAAYKRDALMPIRNKWLKQTFFGRSANIGEDRALTNWIIRTGWHVKFQCDAIVYTNVPIRYEGLVKMLLRWARSNVREMLMMAPFIFTDFRKDSKLGARVNYCLNCLNLTIPNILLLGVIFCILWRPDIFIMQVLLGSIMAACVPTAFYALRRQSSNALWGFAHNIFWVVALSWINLYSILTMHKDSWLTRELEPANNAQLEDAQPQPATQTAA